MKAQVSANKRRALVPAVAALLVALLVCTALAGCGRSSGSSSSSRSQEVSLVGKWEGTIDYEGSDGLTYEYDATLIIYDGDTYELKLNQTGRWLGTDYGSVIWQGDYSFSDSTLRVYTDEDGNYYEFSYAKSSGGLETLTTQWSDGVALTLTKTSSS